MPRTISRSAPQDEPNKIGGHEIEFLATIDAILRRVRDKQTFEICLEPKGIVYAVEKARGSASVIEIGSEQVVGGRVEL